jgi:Protein of unknown function (DUF4231)
MDKETFNEYVEKRYKDQVGYYDKAAGLNQERYKTFQWVLIIFSAATPVLAALETTMANLQVPVIIISSLVAILTTGLKTFQYQELWITYRATNELLKPELFYYKFNVGPYAEEGIDKETLFVSRVEAILDKEHVNWPAAKKLHESEAEGNQGA